MSTPAFSPARPRCARRSSRNSSTGAVVDIGPPSTRIVLRSWPYKSALVMQLDTSAGRFGASGNVGPARFDLTLGILLLRLSRPFTGRPNTGRRPPLPRGVFACRRHSQPRRPNSLIASRHRSWKRLASYSQLAVVINVCCRHGRMMLTHRTSACAVAALGKYTPPPMVVYARCSRLPGSPKIATSADHWPS